MSKILKAADILAAFATAKTQEETDAVIAQVVEAAKAGEDAETANASAIAGLQTELAEANQTIADLGKQVSLRENNPDAGALATVDGIDYQIIGKKFITEKGEITAKQLAEDTELLKEFIAKGSGAIQVLTDVKPSKLV
jgi:hypothetical protein